MDMTLDMTRADLKEAEASETTMQLKLDHNGLPLVPQPSEDPLDPLNFPKWLKLTILIEVSALSLLSLLGASVITPTFGVLSKEFHKSLTETAYITSVFVLTIGLSSAFWNPLANVYGRRPVYLVCIVGSVATAAGSAASTAYGELLALRALNGVFAGIPLGLGSVTVRDLFVKHHETPSSDFEINTDAYPIILDSSSMSGAGTWVSGLCRSFWAVMRHPQSAAISRKISLGAGASGWLLF